MKIKRSVSMLLACIVCFAAADALAIGNNGLTAYGTYWEGRDPGIGAGLKLSKSLLDILYLDLRGGYVVFDDAVDTSVIPLEAALNVGLPGMITPYAGLGVGYYFINENPLLDDRTGYFGQLGLEFTILKIGAMAELRYMDLEGEYFDEDLVVNVGILLRF